MGFVLDPGGGCFMCLKKTKEDIINPFSSSSRSNPSNNALPFKLLTRYLKVETGKVLQLLQELISSSMKRPPPPVDGNNDVEGGVDVPLCGACTTLIGRFSELVSQLELIRLQTEGIVREIHGVMEGANQDVAVVSEYNQRLFGRSSSSSSGLESLALSALSENLRKEVVLKCSSFVRRNPLVELHKLEEEEHCSFVKPEVLLQVDQDEELDPNSTVVIKEELLVPAPPTTPTPPPPATDESAEQQVVDVKPQVSFRKVGKGRIQCKLCWKTMFEKGMASHKLSHHLTGTEFNCDLCSQSFRTSKELSEHKLSAHRALHLAAQHKHPNCSSEQFERVLEEFFTSLDLEMESGRCAADGAFFPCPFCNDVKYKLKSKVEHHIVRFHPDEVGRRLAELQAQQGAQQQSHSDFCAKLLATTTTTTKTTTTPNKPGVKRLIMDSSNSSSSSKKTKITFRKLPSGKYQCGVCSRELTERSRFLHRQVHQSSVRRFQCKLCLKSFRYPNSLADHKFSQHRSSFLAAYREPTKCSFEQFESLVEVLFRGLDLPREHGINGYGPQPFSCCFCPSFRHKLRGGVEAHIIRAHMDELGKRLGELQSQGERPEHDFGGGGCLSPPPPPLEQTQFQKEEPNDEADDNYVIKVEPPPPPEQIQLDTTTEEMTHQMVTVDDDISMILGL